MARIKPLAELLDSCVGKAFAAQGFASTDIIAAWPEIVGERLARFCQPSRIEWPRGKRGNENGRPDPGALIVRVEGAFALELQHLAPVVIQRVNAHYGWACIGRIVLRQGRIERPARRQPPTPLDPARRGEVALAVSRIEDDGLRDALDRLGIAIVSDTPRR
ncbi:hypothetical protein ASG40_18335 [Methylobacterium sp. Leaf399]|uniref:DUF721 domain-containing protein n=1 Tax=unclassified Methylobacterium TaxID=2615210 RepID=UPI0006FBB833|nr:MULTISPECIES: DciA family protein [unclassified Methylobacterium]KQP58107.1 hypothetical protein ASF39_18850 [Methylobacterium sp. Leaf108]KQT16197.1 hypothetical protein ASG40_18335 [Methylobacterium sp. Leaf399]